jgi:NDP-sugar pyrophosphorylase family protein
MQCVILAGGLGTRMRERGGDLPKAMIPVLGKPFLFYQLEWLARQGVRRVILSIGYRGKMISQAVADGSQFGLSVAYSDEGNVPRGTGGALRLAADLGLLGQSFFVLYGDSYLPIELAPIWQTSEYGRICTMTVMRNLGKWDKSNVVFRGGQLVVYDKYAQDPHALGMDYIDYGLSILTRNVIADNLTPGQVTDLAHILNRLSIEGRLRGHEVFERFYEVGSPEGLSDFEKYIASSETNKANCRQVGRPQDSARR